MIFIPLIFDLNRSHLIEVLIEFGGPILLVKILIVGKLLNNLADIIYIYDKLV